MEEKSYFPKTIVMHCEGPDYAKIDRVKIRLEEKIGSKVKYKNVIMYGILSALKTFDKDEDDKKN